MDAKTYDQLTSRHQPSAPVWSNVLKAFLVGGAISLVGQGITNYWTGAHHMGVEQAAAPTSVVMVFLGALLTALGVYDEIGAWGGMGSALPITGFANSVVAPAMEFKNEGYVLGVSSRMYQVAGPVLTFGLVTAFVIGLIYWALGAA